MERVEVKWADAESLLQNADVLLFQGKSWYSFFLRFSGQGKHTHCGIAAKTNGHTSIIEFNERYGARQVNLKHQVDITPGGIDVFRICESIREPIFKDGKVDRIDREFGSVTKKAIVDTFFALTGLKYSWLRIWRLAKYYVPILRWFQKVSTNDVAENPEEGALVCSTAVAWVYRTNGIDLVPNMSDFEVQPSTIARSAYLNYLFTLVP